MLIGCDIIDEPDVEQCSATLLSAACDEPTSDDCASPLVIHCGCECAPPPPGVQKYVHQQIVPAKTWIVNHNLNTTYWQAAVFVGGIPALAPITTVSSSQLTVKFSLAVAGWVVVEA